MRLKQPFPSAGRHDLSHFELLVILSNSNGRLTSGLPHPLIDAEGGGLDSSPRQTTLSVDVSQNTPVISRVDSNTYYEGRVSCKATGLDLLTRIDV